MRSGILALVGVVGLVACTERNPESCAADNFCVDPDRPFCDVDGSVAGAPGKCIAVACEPSTFDRCRGDEALFCNSDGNNFNVTDCANGCDAEGGCRACPLGAADCQRITPRYLPTICSEPATEPSLIISNSTTIDTDLMASCTAVVPQLVGPPICVLHYDVIKIEQTHTVTVTGSRALALVADHELRIDGTLDVSANGRTSGPGGGLIKSGNTEGTGGGGGAGYRHAGGAGGSASADGGAANGGAAAAQSAALVTELLGGRSAEPRAGDEITPGGAGGALTLISCRGKVDVRGTIDAGGGGGRGGNVWLGTPSVIRTPGGGGSGGTVALQAVTIYVAGQIFANGGAGGGGAQAPSIVVGTGGGGDGADGQRSLAPAPQGLGSPASGNGGLGGTGQMPESGQRRVNSGGGDGGGGGSAGYVLFLGPPNVMPTVAIGAIISPPPEPKLDVAVAP